MNKRMFPTDKRTKRQKDIQPKQTKRQTDKDRQTYNIMYTVDTELQAGYATGYTVVSDFVDGSPAAKHGLIQVCLVCVCLHAWYVCVCVCVCFCVYTCKHIYI